MDSNRLFSMTRWNSSINTLDNIPYIWLSSGNEHVATYTTIYCLKCNSHISLALHIAKSEADTNRFDIFVTNHFESRLSYKNLEIEFCRLYQLKTITIYAVVGVLGMMSKAANKQGTQISASPKTRELWGNNNLGYCYVCHRFNLFW